MAMAMAIFDRSDNDANEILDAIMGIMEADEDGPQTPRGKRKRRNGADAFYAGYHADYVNRLMESKDKVNRAQNHNAAYPKLHEELDKRRSIIEVTTIDGRNVPTDYNPDCRACVKLITLSELQRQNLKHKCPGAEYSCRCKGRERERGSRDRIPRDRTPHDKKLRHVLRSRISKHKSHSHRNIPTTSKTMTEAYKQYRKSKSCQYKFTIYVQDEKIGTSNEATELIKPSTSKSTTTARHSKMQRTDPNSTNPQNRDSNISQNVSDPGSHEPSLISRYSSNLSLSHEPMVQP